MDQNYFLGRMNESLAMAKAAESAVAKLIHFDLAGRYSVAAAEARLKAECAGDQAERGVFELGPTAEGRSASSSSRRWRFSITSDSSTSRCVSAMLARSAA